MTRECNSAQGNLKRQQREGAFLTKPILKDEYTCRTRLIQRSFKYVKPTSDYEKIIR